MSQLLDQSHTGIPRHLIMWQTHAYSLLITSTIGNVIKTAKEHVINNMGQYNERTQLLCGCIIVSIKDWLIV